MRSTIQRGAVAAIISVLALANLPSVPAGAASGPKAPPFAAGGYPQLPAPQMGNVRKLKGPAPGGHPAILRPKLVEKHTAPPPKGPSTAPPRAARPPPPPHP